MRFEIRIGHNKTDTREELTNMPFDLTNNPSGLIPTLRLVMELYYPHLYPALWGTTDGALQVRQDATLETVVAGNANEVGDPLLFAELVEVRTRKSCISTEPKLFEPGPVAVNQRRDQVENPISRMGISGSQSCAQKITFVCEAK